MSSHTGWERGQQNKVCEMINCGKTLTNIHEKFHHLLSSGSEYKIHLYPGATSPWVV